MFVFGISRKPTALTSSADHKDGYMDSRSRLRMSMLMFAAAVPFAVSCRDNSTVMYPVTPSAGTASALPPYIAGSTGTSGVSGRAGTPASAERAEPLPAELAQAPKLLSQTGLFADLKTQQLGPGVEAYQPKYALWSDGAEKRRWLKLPAGSRIDTTDPDYWRFPPGTRIWKEFAKDGKVLETRYMAKYGSDPMDWLYLSYQWSPDGTDATATPDGAQNVAGTQHDIPNDLACLKCHEGLGDGALGIAAIQLSHDGPGLTLAALSQRGSLTVPITAPLTIPGDAQTQEALGYLHANCGTCHNPKGGEAFTKNAAIIYLQSTSKLTSLETTTVYEHMVTRTGGNISLLQKGLERMMSRPEKQMPPVATEFVDTKGVAAVGAWLTQLQKAYPQGAFANAGASGGAAGGGGASGAAGARR
ncbi:MAG: hypothetical protein RL701_1123 [Pseudomonadota bacterium]